MRKEKFPMPSHLADLDSVASARIRLLEAENEVLRQALAQYAPESIFPDQKRSLHVTVDQNPAVASCLDKGQQDQCVNRKFFDEQDHLTEVQSIGGNLCNCKKTEAALHAAHEKLEQRVIERTSQLRRLVVDSTLAEERERQALARDLHDGLGQLLHVIRLKVDALKTGLSPTAQAEIAELQTLLTDGSRQVRSLTTQLSPPVLRKLGLTAALRWLCDEMTNQYGLQVDFEHDENIPAVNPVIAEILFRAARELLINVARHAGTRWASLKFVHHENQLWLSVLDNGIGIDKLTDSLEQTDGFGLASLRERIAYIGGNTKINAAPNRGLYVIINLPLNSLLNIPEAR
jgi:signal transduction histidine kinase